MHVEVQGIRLNVTGEYNPGDSRRPPLILLHGFTLSGQEWQPLIPQYNMEFQPIALDLIGHGKSDAPADLSYYTLDSCSQQIIGVLDQLGIHRAFWIGYSMGGRALLHLAITHPDRMHAMVLESTTAGIKDRAERQKRLDRDLGLARFIERHPMDVFVARWTAHPIFRSQKEISSIKREYIKSIRLQNSSIGLANSLRGMGRGAMPSLWESLSKFTIPTLLLAGELDADHVTYLKRMHSLMPKSESHIVKKVGHNIHFERPDLFFDITRAFFNDQKG